MNRYIIASAIVLGSLSFQDAQANLNTAMHGGKMDKQKLIGLSMVSPTFMEEKAIAEKDAHLKDAIPMKKDHAVPMKKERDPGMPIAIDTTNQMHMSKEVDAVK